MYNTFSECRDRSREATQVWGCNDDRVECWEEGGHVAKCTAESSKWSIPLYSNPEDTTALRTLKMPPQLLIVDMKLCLRGMPQKWLVNSLLSSLKLLFECLLSPSQHIYQGSIFAWMPTRQVYKCARVTTSISNKLLGYLFYGDPWNYCFQLCTYVFVQLDSEPGLAILLDGDGNAPPISSPSDATSVEARTASPTHQDKALTPVGSQRKRRHSRTKVRHNL